MPSPPGILPIQDQLRSLHDLLGSQPELASRVYVNTYDGDTPHAERNDIRDTASIILSNPDMLHASILPQHTFWKVRKYQYHQH